MERPNNTTLALLGGVAALLILLALFAASRNMEQDKLGDSASFSAADNPDLNRACSGQAIYDQIKRALFRQAAQVRGKDAPAYEQLAVAASVRMENAVAEGQSGELVDCSGSLSIDLPPGVATVAGRHMLMSDIYYGVALSPGGGKQVVQLRNANMLVDSLATLTLIVPPTAPMPQPIAEVPMNDLGIDQTPPSVDPAAPALAPSGIARPSVDCANARSRSEQAVCADPGLASLDRAMAAEYSRALAASTPVQAATLRQTRERFLAYRDRCPNSSCITDAYTGRIREIRDIMAGRPQPGR